MSGDTRHRKTIKATCTYCGKVFEKVLTEFVRSEKLGRRHFCSLNCSTAQSNKENPWKGNPQVLIPGNHRDEFTPFRWFLARCRNRQNKYGKTPKVFLITLDDLVDQWKQQDGVCPYT